jgi:hypothetical protein
MTQVGVGPGKETRYYTAHGRATDVILRCKDCKTIVQVKDITRLGACPGDGVTGCGNKRFAEITQLTDAEYGRLSMLDFPFRDEFLAEFSAHG